MALPLWSKVRKVLGLLTDVLTFGRGKGWWSEHQTVTPPQLEDPARRLRRPH